MSTTEQEHPLDGQSPQPEAATPDGRRSTAESPLGIQVDRLMTYLTGKGKPYLDVLGEFGAVAVLTDPIGDPIDNHRYVLTGNGLEKAVPYDNRMYVNYSDPAQVHFEPASLFNAIIEVGAFKQLPLDEVVPHIQQRLESRASQLKQQAPQLQ